MYLLKIYLSKLQNVCLLKLQICSAKIVFQDWTKSRIVVVSGNQIFSPQSSDINIAISRKCSFMWKHWQMPNRPNCCACNFKISHPLQRTQCNFLFSFGSIFVEDRRAGIEGVLAGLKIQTNFSQINDASYKHTYYPDYNYSPKDRSPPKSILGFWNSCADLKFQLNILNSWLSVPAAAGGCNSRENSPRNICNPPTSNLLLSSQRSSVAEAIVILQNSTLLSKSFVWLLAPHCSRSSVNNCMSTNTNRP